MRTNLFLLLLTMTCFFIKANAQTGEVYGNVKTTDNKPLEAATVSLLKTKDSSLIKIAEADKAGVYKFENIRYGNYMVQAEALGHDKSMSKIFDLNEAHPSIAVDNISLASGAKVLARVNITAQRPLIENKIDKTIVNVY